jgi:hypothetical protein
MNNIIYRFLTDRKLGGLELGMTRESALNAIPGLSLTREADELSIFELDDLFVSFVEDRVFGFSVYVRGEVPTLPSEIGPWTFPTTKSGFLRFLAQNDLSTSPHFNLLGNKMGVQLVSGVLVLFDGGDVFSIRSPIL